MNASLAQEIRIAGRAEEHPFSAHEYHMPLLVLQTKQNKKIIQTRQTKIHSIKVWCVVSLDLLFEKNKAVYIGELKNVITIVFIHLYLIFISFLSFFFKSGSYYVAQ